MYNNNCGCNGNNNNDIWWIIIIIAVFLILFCGWGTNSSNGCGCTENPCC